MAKRKYPLSELTKEKEDVINQLATRLQQGDLTARNLLIEECISFARQLANAIVNYSPSLEHMREDIESIGLTALVEKVDILKDRHSKRSVVPFLVVSIKNAIIDEIRHQQIQLNQCQSLGSFLEDVMGNEDVCRRKSSLIPVTLDTILARSDPGYEESDCLDLLSACCLTDEEYELIELRMQGFTLREIEQKMGQDHCTIYRMLVSIQERYNKKQVELDD